MLATTRNGIEYLVSVRKHHRWTSEEELVFFKELEADEKRFYALILSFLPLGKVNVKKLSALFAAGKEQNEERNAKFEQMMEYYDQESLTKAQIRSFNRLINAVTSDFRMMEAPRLWARFVMRDLCSPSHMLNTDEFDFFAGHVRDKLYLDWCKKVMAAGSRILRKKNDFLEDNTGLVGSIIKRRCPAGSNIMTPYLDLQQEGFFGLMKAFDKFDYKRGLKFSTYASWWVRHSLSRAICDKDKMIRVPVHVHDKVSSVRMYQNDFLRKHHRDASVEEIMKELNMSEKQVRDLITAPLFFSFDAKLTQDDTEADFYSISLEPEASVADRVHLKSSFDEVCAQDVKRRLRAAIKTLTPKEREIIKGRFGVSTKMSTDDTFTLKEIGDDYKLSRERIRQLETQALEKLRDAMKAKKINSPSDICAN